MLGSGAVLGAVCDDAGLQSNTATEKKATAEGATKRDDILMTMSFQGRARRPNVYHI
jgi:hypothetical protein